MDGRGVNVAVFSEQATRIELCLLDSAEARRESERLPLPVQTGRVWHGYFPDLRPGQLGNGVNFRFPARLRGRPAQLVLDTADQNRTELDADGGYVVQDRSVGAIRFPRN